MAQSTLRGRVCAHCAGPIWYNTFLMEWFHDSPDAETHVTTGVQPAPIQRTRKTKASKE